MQSAKTIQSPIPFHSVTEADNSLFERVVFPKNCRNCDLNFVNIVSWQDTFHSMVCLWRGFVLIKFKTSDNRTAYMQPIGEGDFTAAIEAMLADAALSGEPLRLYGVDSTHKELLKRAFPGKFAFGSSKSTEDYIYLTADLASLPGRRFQAKRNLINQFKSGCSYRFESITQQNIEDCLSVNTLWCQKRGVTPEDCEQMALKRMIDNFFTLPIKGWILYHNDTPCAFTIGSAVCNDTFCIHIEKSNTDIKGAAAAINNLTAQALLSEYKYINREEDMGLKGLRQAKLSYNPTMMFKKYSALALGAKEQQIIALWRDVFGDSIEDIENFITQFYTPELAFTICDKNRVVSMLHIVPLTHNNHKIAYIYAVATAPEYRGRGFASSLINKAVQYIDSADFSYAMLIPSSAEASALYEKFGFKESGEIFDFSALGIDFDFGTGDISKDFTMVRESCSDSKL